MDILNLNSFYFYKIIKYIKIIFLHFFFYLHVLKTNKLDFLNLDFGIFSFMLFY